MTAVDLSTLISPEIMAAAVLAESGTFTADYVTCRTCGDPAMVHGAFDGCLTFDPDPVQQLAADALGAADREAMDDIVDMLDAEYIPSGRKGPSPSDAGGCERQVYYRDNPPADFVPALVDRRRAALGTLIHRAAEKARRARYAGWMHHEVEVEVPGLRRRGRIDEYDPILGRVTDFKSHGVRKWEIVGEAGPSEDAWEQGDIYGYVLDEAGLPVRTIRIIVINRDTGEEEAYERPYDPARGKAAIDKLVMLDDALQAGLVPPRHPDAVLSSCWRCTWCEARTHCWQLDAAAEAGRSPESWVTLGPAPTDPTIVWAGGVAIAAKSAASSAEQAKKAAMALLDGIREDTYGPKDKPDEQVVIGTGSTTSYGYKEAYERLAHYYELPDGMRPPLDRVGYIEKKTTRYPTVNRPPKHPKRQTKRKKK